jgi:predicted metal-dependent hydrolase
MIIKTSRKTRYLRLAVYPDGRVVLTKPYGVSVEQASAFVKTKSSWIEKKLEIYKNRKVIPLDKPLASKQEALDFVKERIDFYNQHYKFEINKITIKNHKTLWGSCSRNKNLNFNHKLMHLPQYQADYIIVHELCHLREFNHSKKFWDLVTETIPNPTRIRKELRNYTIS